MSPSERKALELIEARPDEPAAVRADRSEAETLDPGDWDAFRASLHAAADRALDHLETRSERPVWRPVDEAAKAAIDEPLPVDPQGISKVIEDIEAFVLPHDTGNTHPRFFGWVHGAGTAGGMVAELFAAAINANLGGRDHGAVYIERQVLKWACRMFGLPDGAGGLLVSGTSMATLIALTVARNMKSNGDLRADGLRAQSRPLVGYASAEAHSSVAKAFEILGLGGRALRSVPVDETFSIDAGALRDAIRKDVAAGNQPFAVIGTAGTVNTGAIDPLDKIADICSAHDLWFHVDGAFGGLAVLAQAQADKVCGIERADSIAFDFHKWLHVPYDAGCVLLRDGDLQRQTFATRPDYLQGLERGLAGGDPWFCELGPELSRGFRALKVWLTLKEHGVARLGAMIARNCAQAEYLAGRVAAEHRLELLAPVSLNICCFRFTGGELGAERTDELNKEIVIQLQERGIAAPSTTRIDGRLAIRVNITNHRTRTADLDLLVNAVLELGHDLLFSPQFTGAGADERRCGADPAGELPQASVADAMPVLDRALSRPEIAALAGNVSIKIAPRIDTVFRLEKGVVHLHPSGLRSVPAASALLRHALELVLWQDAQTKPESHELLARALACARTAALYLDILPANEQTEAEEHLPSPLVDIYRRLREDHAFADLAALFGNTAIEVDLLLALEGLKIPPPPAEGAVRVRASNLLAGYAVLAAPVEMLLTRGGDRRIALNPGTGRTGYGSSPRPCPDEISFSSSTASSIDAGQYAACEALRQKLIHATIGGSGEDAFAAEMERTRSEIAALCGVAGRDDVDVALSASGTDAEFLALHFARPDHETPLVTIVIEPGETGSGVPLAATGRHFASRTASGAEVEKGEPIAGIGSERIFPITIGLRDARGAVRPAAAIDGEVERTVALAAAKGARCLLRVLDSSKTGAGAPSIAAVDRLCEKYGDTVTVLVDACQMRCDRAALRAYAERGWLVQVTGSKFFGGVPFAGALLVPRADTGAARPCAPVAEGLADYASRFEWPGTWPSARDALPQARNVGLLLRWTSALESAGRLAIVDDEDWLACARNLERRLSHAVDGSAGLSLLQTPVFDRTDLGMPDRWADLPTILAFTIEDPATGAPLDLQALKQVHRLLMKDLSDRICAAGRSQHRDVMARPCHLGQPVQVNGGNAGNRAVLRLCISARTIAEAMGEGKCDERIGAIIEHAGIALQKLRLIVDNLAELNGGCAN